MYMIQNIEKYGYIYFIESKMSAINFEFLN